MGTMLIQFTNEKALKLLYDLEELNLIKVIKENVVAKKVKLSDKYKGILTKKEGEKLNKHIKQIRGEWDNI